MGYMDSNHGMIESKSIALPTWLYPNGIKCFIKLNKFSPLRKKNQGVASKLAAKPEK